MNASYLWGTQNQCNKTKMIKIMKSQLRVMDDHLGESNSYQIEILEEKNQKNGGKQYLKRQFGNNFSQLKKDRDSQMEEYSEYKAR